MKFSKVLSVMLLMMFVASGYAQKTLSGTVTNSKNKPVAKALIYLDSINSGVKTDKKGYYKVEVPENVKDINIYSYKYGLLSSKITIEDIINFVYIEVDKKQKAKKNQKVAIAYSEEEQAYVVNKIPTISPSKELKDVSNYTNIYDLIRGRVAGVTVTQNNKVRIRGVNSPNSTSDPLFILDGTPVFNIDNVLPINVKSIKILKGSDAAIYGSRGANGVVVITTKT